MSARVERPALGRLIATTAIAALVLATVSFAMGSRGASRRASANVSLTAGSFSSSNSRDGAAIFTARNVRPGGASTGQVTIANSGQLAGSFSLAQSGLSDRPGQDGGRLSELGQLDVSDVTRPDAPTPVYAGSLGAMPTSLPLGTFRPGEAHTYSFTVSLPADAPTGADLNAYQASALQVAYAWKSTGGAPPSSVPAPPSTSPSDPPPTATQPSDPPPAHHTPPVTNAPGSPPTTHLPAAPTPHSPSTASPTPAPSPASPAAPPATATPGAPRPATSSPAGSTPSFGSGGTTSNRGATPGHSGGSGGPAARPRRAAGPHPRHPHRRGLGAAHRAGAGSPPHHQSKSLLSNLLSAVQRVASAVVKHGAFPFTLLLIMLAFFYLQYWLDRRDPKLALAPVDPEPSRSFE